MHEAGLVVFFTISALVAFGAAVLVYAGRPHRAGNRYLAVGLFLQGIAESTGALGRLHGFPESVGGTALGLRVVFLIASLSWILLYPFFISTLETPLARVLRNPFLRLAVAAYGVAVGLLGILEPGRLLGPPDTPPSLLIMVPLVLISTYGIVVALQLWRRASRAGLERRQATAYLAAFGIRDTALFVFAAAAITRPGLPFDPGAVAVFRLLPPIANLLSAILLTYGILSVQLLDIDLKIKAAFVKTSLLGLFAAIFFVASELVESILAIDGTAVGIAAAAAVALALRPLNRGARRLADILMPETHDTPEYRTQRGQAVYLAAYRSAIADGSIRERERRMLDALAKEIGLSGPVLRRLEQTEGKARPARS